MIRSRLLRRASLGSAALVSAILLAPRARAETTEQCVTSATAADRLRRDPTTLRSAQEKLLVCSHDECPEVIRNDCRSWLGELEAVIPTVILVAEDASGSPLIDARVQIDGVQLEPARFGQPIPLDAGVHTFAFQQEGRTIERRVVLVAREKDVVVRVRFEAAVASPPAPAAVPTPPKPRTDAVAPGAKVSVLPAVGLGALALGVVGLGLGTFFGLRAAAKQDDANCPDNVCGARSDPDALRDAKTFGNLSTGFFVGGGALAIGGAALFLLTRSSSPAPLPPSASSSAQAKRVRIAPFGVGMSLVVEAF